MVPEGKNKNFIREAEFFEDFGTYEVDSGSETYETNVGGTEMGYQRKF